MIMVSTYNKKGYLELVIMVSLYQQESAMDLKVAGRVPKFDRWSGHLLGGVQFPLRDSQSYYTQLDTNIGRYLQLWLQVEVCRQYKFTLLNPMV